MYPRSIKNWLSATQHSHFISALNMKTFYTTAQACRLLFSSSQLMPASLFSCTDTRQNNLITRLCFICYTVHNFCCFLPAWYSQNTCRHDTTGEDSNKSISLSCCALSIWIYHLLCYINVLKGFIVLWHPDALLLLLS